jgi:hypothetical protein
VFVFLAAVNNLLNIAPGVSRFPMIKTGKPPSSFSRKLAQEPLSQSYKPEDLSQGHTPFAFNILSPGSKIGHTRRKNPQFSVATSRVNA